MATSVSLSACGGGARQDAQEPSGNFPVAISASFPTRQRLSEHTAMLVTVRNVGSKPIPNVAVTVTEPHWGTAVQPFGAYFAMPGVAYHSRPAWIIDAAPGPCNYSCRNGGAGGAVTADPHTWALGELKPGQTARFRWAVTAVMPGRHGVTFAVAAGLNGKARAQLAGGGVPRGSFYVAISGRPGQSFVTAGGQVVRTPNPG